MNANQLFQHPEFRRGAREMVGPALGIAAWGLVTGVAMAKSGLTLAQALAMSLLVFAGSAQLTSLPLLAAGAPLWVILATAFCVNLRFAIFSARWRDYFGHLPLRRRLTMGYLAGDMNFVLFVKRWPEPRPEPAQIAYFWGGAAVNWPAWQIASIAGILLAHDVPVYWNLGFAGVLALLAMALSLLHERVLWVVAGVAAGVSIATYALPFRLNIVCAILAAGAAGWFLDSRRSRS